MGALIGSSGAILSQIMCDVAGLMVKQCRTGKVVLDGFGNVFEVQPLVSWNRILSVYDIMTLNARILYIFIHLLPLI